MLKLITASSSVKKYFYKIILQKRKHGKNEEHNAIASVSIIRSAVQMKKVKSSVSQLLSIN